MKIGYEVGVRNRNLVTKKLEKRNATTPKR